MGQDPASTRDIRWAPSREGDTALRALWSLAFADVPAPLGFTHGNILIGKSYGDANERTEVDVGIEGEGVLVFIEAKLYSSMSLAVNAGGKT